MSIENLNRENFEIIKTPIKGKHMISLQIYEKPVDQNKAPASELLLEEEGTSYIISHRHTQPKFRGEGYGSILLNEAKKEGREIKLKTSQLEVIQWALKNGFEVENTAVPTKDNLQELGYKEITAEMRSTGEMTKVLVSSDFNEINATQADIEKNAIRITLSFKNVANRTEGYNKAVNAILEDK